MLCEYCENPHSGNYGSGRFCSFTCARKFSSNKNTDGLKPSHCVDCGKDILIHKKASHLSVKCENCKKRPSGVPGKTKCVVCNNYFPTREDASRLCGELCKATYKLRRKKSIKIRVASHRRKIKLKAIEYKGGECIVCNYNKTIRSLIFHHLDPAKKEIKIGSGNTLAWKKVKKELDKCALLCANCHGEVHDGLIDLKTFISK